MSEPMNVIAKDTEASAMPHGAAAAASVNNGGMIVMVVAIVAMLLIAACAGVAGYSVSRSNSAYDLAVEAKSDARVGITANARADAAYSLAQEAKMEDRVKQSKLESLRNEVAELKGMNETKPKEK